MQADLVITLFVVGLLLALTTLVLNFTSPHVNAIITVGSFSALSFVGALIAWVMMSKIPPPSAIPHSQEPIASSQIHDPASQMMDSAAIPAAAPAAAESVQRQDVTTVSGQSVVVPASVVQAEGASVAPAITANSAAAAAAVAIEPLIPLPLAVPSAASNSACAAASVSVLAVEPPALADSAPAAAAAAVVPQAAVESTPWEDKYAPLYARISGKYPSPSKEAPITAFLEPNESGLSYLNFAVLAGAVKEVESICKRLPTEFVFDDNPLKKDQMLASTIQDRVEGLTPLHLVGRYLMIHWKNTSGLYDKSVVQGNAEMMLQHVRFILLKDSSNEDIGIKDVKDPQGRNAKAYFEEVLAPNAPEELADILLKLASKLPR